jgi:hypothetical protein
LLIRRPLLQLGSIRQSGFAPGPVFEALGLAFDPRDELETCPMLDRGSVCEQTA